MSLAKAFLALSNINIINFAGLVRGRINYKFKEIYFNL